MRTHDEHKRWLYEYQALGFLRKGKSGPLSRLEAANRARAQARADAQSTADQNAYARRVARHRARNELARELQETGKGVPNLSPSIVNWFDLDAVSPRPQPEEKPATLDVEGVVGFRTWDIGDDGNLESLNAHESWPSTGVHTARCRTHSHEAPQWHCECGLYGLYEVTDIPLWGGQQAIIGAILGWGRVYAHREGFRAQYAEVVAVTSRYHGFGPSIPELITLAKEHGELVPPEHRYAQP